jgi:hypothetical protein
MGIELVASGQAIWGLVKGLLESHDKAKAELFQVHVDPLHQRILALHKDYMAAFAELRARLAKPETTMSDVVSFLEQRRMDFLCERDLAAQTALAFSQAERRLVRLDASQEVFKFCVAVASYLYSPYEFLPRGSFFTSVISVADPARNLDYSKALQLSPSAEPAVLAWEFTDLVREIHQRLLPSKMSEVNAAHARLRVLLL